MGSHDGVQYHAEVVPRKDEAPNPRHEWAIKAHMHAHFLYVVTQDATLLVCPSMFGEVVRRGQFVMDQSPSKKFAFVLRSCSPNEFHALWGVESSKLGLVG